MSVEGLSLLGFMKHAEAMEYLDTLCLFDSVVRSEYERMWHQAQEQVRVKMPRAGRPEIRNIDPKYHPHLDKVVGGPYFRETVKGLGQHRIGLVEIDPLIAFQYHIGIARTEQHASHKQRKPTDLQVLKKCLPAKVAHDEMSPAPPRDGEIWITTPSLNVVFHARGTLPAKPVGKITKQLWVAGVEFGPASPLVHIAHFRGLYFLRNGYHRAFMLRQAGVEYMPCIIVEPSSMTAFADREFQRIDDDVLLSESPPTVGHFTQGLAYPVRLRKLTKVIHVTWSEEIIAE